MNLNKFILALTLLIPAMLVAKPPNIVYIISDDQSWNDYGFMGHPDIQTPHLDKLASVLFNELRTWHFADLH